MPVARALLILTMCALVTVGCGRTPRPFVAPSAPPPAPDPAPPAPPPPIPEGPAPAALPGPPSEDELFAQKTLGELNAERPLADAFFDFDQWQVREDARADLQANATWLRRWPSTRVTIEGHCDVRGTSEYNLALGERRGAAVKTYLVTLGIEPERLIVVSKGKETPFCTSDTEQCWQQNRRGHFIITAK